MVERNKYSFYSDRLVKMKNAKQELKYMRYKAAAEMHCMLIIEEEATDTFFKCNVKCMKS